MYKYNIKCAAQDYTLATNIRPHFKQYFITLN